MRCCLKLKKSPAHNRDMVAAGYLPPILQGRKLCAGVFFSDDQERIMTWKCRVKFHSFALIGNHSRNEFLFSQRLHENLTGLQVF